MMSWRWPRPIGVMASTALRPVCSGSWTDLRWTTEGACSSSGAAVGRLDLAETVDRLAERVDDTTEEGVADRHREDLAGALDLLALLDAAEVTEDDDADVVDVEVERETEGAVLELEQLVGHGRGQALDVRDAVTGVEDAADLFALGGRPGRRTARRSPARRGSPPDGSRAPSSSFFSFCRVRARYVRCVRSCSCGVAGPQPPEASCAPRPGVAGSCRRRPRRRPARGCRPTTSRVDDDVEVHRLAVVRRTAPAPAGRAGCSGGRRPRRRPGRQLVAAGLGQRLVGLQDAVEPTAAGRRGRPGGPAAASPVRRPSRAAARRRRRPSGPSAPGGRSARRAGRGCRRRSARSGRARPRPGRRGRPARRPRGRTRRPAARRRRRGRARPPSAARRGP